MSIRADTAVPRRLAPGLASFAAEAHAVAASLGVFDVSARGAGTRSARPTQTSARPPGRLGSLVPGAAGFVRAARGSSTGSDEGPGAGSDGSWDSEGGRFAPPAWTEPPDASGHGSSFDGEGRDSADDVSNGDTDGGPDPERAAEGDGYVWRRQPRARARQRFSAASPFSTLALPRNDLTGLVEAAEGWPQTVASRERTWPGLSLGGQVRRPCHRRYGGPDDGDDHQPAHRRGCGDPPPSSQCALLGRPGRRRQRRLDRPLGQPRRGRWSAALHHDCPGHPRRSGPAPGVFVRRVCGC